MEFSIRRKNERLMEISRSLVHKLNILMPTLEATRDVLSAMEGLTGGEYCPAITDTIHALRQSILDAEKELDFLS